jgi:tripartite-type tricarboxylate transporter receptor subunit TctC
MHPLARCMLTVACAVAFSPFAWAQSWPVKPIRLIVNLTPGTAGDLIARAIAPRMGETFGQPVIVENRPGASGNMGVEAVAKSAPDGYTLVHTSGSTIAINPHLYKLAFDMARDLEPIAPTMRTNVILVVRQDSPARTVAELIAHIRANNGKLNYGSAGSGSGMHIATEVMLRLTNTKANHVPYKGSAPAIADLLGGRLDFTFDPGVAVPHIKAGKLRLLAVARPTRSALFPDTPTMAEAGTDVDMDVVFGVYGAAGTPREAVTRLNREIVRIMQTPELGAALTTIGAELVTGSAEWFASRQRSDRARFAAVVRENNIRAD